MDAELMGGIVGAITGVPARNRAREQAKATKKAADDQAASDRLMAQSAQNSRETIVAQDAASRAAAELLSKPQDKLDVSLAPDIPDAEIDPNSGRRRTARSSFMSRGGGASGINIQ